MNTRNSVILAAAAIVVLALGLVFGTGNRDRQTEIQAGQRAFPGLAAKLQDAAKLEVTTHGSTLTLARKGDFWTLPDKAGYPAQQAKVRELLASLTDLKLAEQRTANPDEYARLGVEEAGKDAASTLVRVLDGSGGVIAGLIVGHEHAGSRGVGDGVYVRRPGEAQAWLADGRLAVSADPQQWIDRDIANIAQTRVAGVTVTRGGQTLQFARDGDKLTLKSPADHPKLDQFKVDDLGRGLEALTLTEVKPAPPPGTPEGEAVFTTGDGLKVTATVNKAGSDIWAQFAVAGDDTAKAEAEALQARLKGWAYQLEAWKEQALVPTLDDLKAYQPPPPAPAAPPPAATPQATPAPAPAAK
jgi:hypothetical protein